jgi:hypothetical protein
MLRAYQIAADLTYYAEINEQCITIVGQTENE